MISSTRSRFSYAEHGGVLLGETDVPERFQFKDPSVSTVVAFHLDGSVVASEVTEP